MQVCSLKKQSPTGEKRGKLPYEDSLCGVNRPPQSRSPYTPTPSAPDGGAGAARSGAAAPRASSPGSESPRSAHGLPLLCPARASALGRAAEPGCQARRPRVPGLSMPGARLWGPLMAQAPPPAAPRCRPRPRRPQHLASAETRTRGADPDRSSS